MAYTISTAIAIYFVLWWVTLFLTLPFGVRSQHETDGYTEGTDPGAPVLARIGMKLIWTTIVASIVFAVLATIYKYKLIDVGAFMAWLIPAR